MLQILFLALTLNAFAADAPMDQLTQCEGQYRLQELFLFAGRAEEPLVRDPAATDFIRTIEWKRKPLRPVGEAYSARLFPGYIDYSSLRGRVDRLAVVLAENNGDLPYENGWHDLLLIVTEGQLKGHVLAQHTAIYKEAEGKLYSDFFSCWK